MMRRPKNRRRLGVSLCGIAVAAGCSHYLARQDFPAVATAKAPTIAKVAAPAPPAQWAKFDVDAVRSSLATASPYCPAKRLTTADLPPAPLVAKAASPPDEGVPGVCVLRTTYVGGQGAVPPVAAPAALPGASAPPVKWTLVSASQVGFAGVNEGGPSGGPSPGQKLYVVPIGNTVYPPPAAAPPVAALDAESAFPRAAPPPRRKSFVDTTAAPCFGHAPDYHWLSGQVEYSRILHGWRLRYASVDESDRFAGSVTLVENAHVGYLHDGEYVRVVGHLVNPDADRPAPAYRIESFRVIDNPNDPGSTTANAAEQANAPATAAAR